MATSVLITVEEFARRRTSETEHYELVERELLPLPSANPMQADIRDFWCRFCETTLTRIRGAAS